MTPRDDRFADMPPSVQFDAAIEQALRGDAAGDDVATFARFVDDVRVMGDRPPPPPSPALAALLAGSAATREARSTTVPRPPRTRSLLRARLTQQTSRRSRPAWIRMRIAAVPIAGKAAVLLVVATAATAGAAAGVLEPATQFVRRAIEVVTPFELPGDDDAPSEHADQRMDHPSAAGIDPDATALPPAASRPAAIAAGAGDAHDPGVEASADPQPEPIPADEVSSWAETYPKPEPSAWPTTPSPPTSSPPQSEAPKKATPPDAGSPTEPGPNTGHVPPGHASPSTPRPGGPGSGDEQLFDSGPSTGRLTQPPGKGRPARPGPSARSPSNPSREQPRHGSPPGAGPGPGSNEDVLSSGPAPAGHGSSARGGRDRGECGQSRAGAPRPADCAPGAPHDPGRGPRADTGSAQALDTAEPEPPLPQSTAEDAGEQAGGN
jgi:hypothetical protein